MHADRGAWDEVLVDQMEVDKDVFHIFVDSGARISEEWMNFALEKLTVNNGHKSTREYDSIMVTKGQMFHDKVHLHYAVKRWCLSEQMEFKVVISNPRTYDVKCLGESCTWRGHEFLPMCDTIWVAPIVQPHTCNLRHL